MEYIVEIIGSGIVIVFVIFCTGVVFNLPVIYELVKIHDLLKNRQNAEKPEGD